MYGSTAYVKMQRHFTNVRLSIHCSMIIAGRGPACIPGKLVILNDINEGMDNHAENRV